MGSHVSPPFAIIFMHLIEEKALKLLYEAHKFTPKIYVRYIDDILIGPVIRNDVFCKTILDIFNSINENIKFTMEVPNVNEPVNFLDLAITISEKDLCYNWYRKECHSGILLRPDSSLPLHTKLNFINNTFKTIEKRCSSIAGEEEKSREFESLLVTNGYKREHIRAIKSKQKNKKMKNKLLHNMNRVPLFLNYLSEQASRKIKNAINKYDLNVNLISKPAPQLCQLLRNRNSQREYHNCRICQLLNKDYECTMRYVVYKLTCTFCRKFYIGQTNRPFHFRYKEHEHSLNHQNALSALGEHALHDHSDIRMKMTDFDVEFVEVHKNPIDCKIGEAKIIQRSEPQLNRKHELKHW